MITNVSASATAAAGISKTLNLSGVMSVHKPDGKRRIQ